MSPLRRVRCLPSDSCLLDVGGCLQSDVFGVQIGASAARCCCRSATQRSRPHSLRPRCVRQLRHHFRTICLCWATFTCPLPSLKLRCRRHYFWDHFLWATCPMPSAVVLRCRPTCTVWCPAPPGSGHVYRGADWCLRSDLRSDGVSGSCVCGRLRARRLAATASRLRSGRGARSRRLPTPRSRTWCTRAFG